MDERLGSRVEGAGPSMLYDLVPFRRPGTRRGRGGSLAILLAVAPTTSRMVAPAGSGSCSSGATGRGSISDNVPECSDTSTRPRQVDGQITKPYRAPCSCPGVVQGTVTTRSMAGATQGCSGWTTFERPAFSIAGKPRSAAALLGRNSPPRGE